MGAITQLILESAPQIIALIQQRHSDANPGAPPLTPQQIEEGFDEAFSSSLLKDELIKAGKA